MVSPDANAVAIAGLNWVREKTATIQGNLPMVWTFNNTAIYTVVTAPDGGQTTYTFECKDDPSNCTNHYMLNRVVQVDSPGGLRIVREWDQNKTYGMQGYYVLPNNLYVKKETITIGLPSNAKTRVIEYVYDVNGRLRERKERDWNASNGAPGAVLRNRATIYTVQAPDASSVPGAIANHVNAYWNNTGRLTNVLSNVMLDGANNLHAATAYGYNSNGKKTAEGRWDSEKSPSFFIPPPSSITQTFTYTYDIYGNLTDTYEPDVRTHMTYDGNGRILSSIAGYGTPALQRTTNYTWLNGMAVYTVTDVENGIGEMYQYDNVGRKINEYSVSGGTYLSRVSRVIDDINNKVTIKRDLKTYNDQKLQTITHYDQLGRKVLEQYSEGSALNGSGDGIKIKTIYEHFNGGSRVITSTPYRSISDPALQWKCTHYDTAGRVTATATFNSNSGVLNPPSSCTSLTNRTGITQITYAGEWTTIIDPAGKTRMERSDALGRLAEVIEDPGGLGYITTYEYDAMDNLLETRQDDGINIQIRTFEYSSLGRLLSTTTPESGTTYFTYHDNGLVNRQTDARGKYSETQYDALHRITQRTYSDGTPAVKYAYYQSNDGPQAGRLKSISSIIMGIAVVGTTEYVYNNMGDVISSSQNITGYSPTLNFSYEWYLGGGLKVSVRRNHDSRERALL